MTEVNTPEARDLSVRDLSDEDLYREIFKDSLHRAFRSKVEVPLLEDRYIFELPALAEETLETFLSYKAKGSVPPLLYKSFKDLDNVLSSFSEISRKINRVTSPDLRLLFMLLEEGPCQKAFSYPPEGESRETTGLQGFYVTDLALKLLNIDKEELSGLLSLPCLKGLIFSARVYRQDDNRSKERALLLLKNSAETTKTLQEYLAVGRYSTDEGTDLGEVLSILEYTYKDTGKPLTGFEMTGGKAYFDVYSIDTPKFRRPLYSFIKGLMTAKVEEEGDSSDSSDSSLYPGFNEATFLYAFWYLMKTLKEGESYYTELLNSEEESNIAEIMFHFSQWTIKVTRVLDYLIGLNRVLSKEATQEG